MTLAEQIQLACLMEATARKPGNVHPAASFPDLTYNDFVLAAQAVANPLTSVHTVGLGRAIYDAIAATRERTCSNVNLGIVLLLAPLAAVLDGVPLKPNLSAVLNTTTTEDAEYVYAAIGLAQPGGMGRVSSQDVGERPTITLRDAMSLAADRDRIAEQYVNEFKLVFAARDKFCEFLSQLRDWELAIVKLHVWILSQWPDTLIARKCGRDVAEKATAKARQLLDDCNQNGRMDPEKLEAFDRWLRAAGNRRNPGTTADLIAATLFAAIRDALIETPSRESIEHFARSISSVPGGKA